VSARVARFYLGLIEQDHVQQGIMDFQLSVVLDKAQFAELVHEESLGNGVVRPKPSGLVAIPSWARPSVVAGGATCALKRALVQAGIEAKSARQSPPFCLVRTAGDDGCSAPAATRGGRRLLFCGGTNCDVGFHILRRHQTNLVTEPRQLTCPVVRRGAGLHANEARRQRREKGNHLTAAKLLPDDDPSRPRIGSSAQIEVCKPEGKITKGKARAQLDRCFGR
jgi:hypothetical protein